MKGSKNFRGRTSRGEFSRTTRLQARLAIRNLYQRESESESDPVIELIACLLEDGGGAVSAFPKAELTTDQWATWNHLALHGPEALALTLTRELEREKSPMPSDPEAMRTWAARLVVATLDRLGMA